MTEIHGTLQLQLSAIQSLHPLCMPASHHNPEIQALQHSTSAALHRCHTVLQPDRHLLAGTNSALTASSPAFPAGQKLIYAAVTGSHLKAYVYLSSTMVDGFHCAVRDSRGVPQLTAIATLAHLSSTNLAPSMVNHYHAVSLATGTFGRLFSCLRKALKVG